MRTRGSELLIVISALVLAACGARAPPANFVALARVTASLTGIRAPGGSSFFAPFSYDARQGVHFQVEHATLNNSATRLIYDVYESALGRQMVFQGQCRSLSEAPFSPWFSWIGAGNEAPQRVADGRLCDVVTLTVPGRFNLTYGSDAATGAPVFFQTGPLVHVVWRNVSAGGAVISPECPPPTYCAPQQPVMQTLPMVRLHDASDYSIADENLGDVVGDTMWLCYNIVGGNDIKGQLMSIFLVSANTTWGQYALCNDKVCIGGKGQVAVGREAFAGIAPHGGQCSPNTKIGTWYSLTSEAEGVTWKKLRRVKSIATDCLLQLGLEKMCAPHLYPFPEAVALVESSFASRCPDVPPAK